MKTLCAVDVAFIFLKVYIALINISRKYKNFLRNFLEKKLLIVYTLAETYVF